MIGTPDTQQAQLTRGFYQNGSGNEVILILGSCRTVAYLNYLVRYNNTHGQPFTVCFIDPHYWHWNTAGELVDLDAALLQCEKDPRILSLLSRASIFIHEYYENFGMFNTRSDAVKNIYQFGLAPRVNCCLPNWHDHFVLFNEQLQFDNVLKYAVHDDRGTALRMMRDSGLSALEKFYSVCRMSDFPELEDEFRDNWTKRRFFWTGNHVSKHFTLFLMRQMNERFLKLPMGDDFWAEAEKEDQFSTPCTAVTQYDVDAYGLDWGCPIEPLKL